VIKELSHTFADQFYQLDRELFPRQQEVSSSIVLFTSSHFGEGVTSVTLAFALFLAKIHGPEGVIAFDANLREPSFAQILGLKPTASLLQAATGAVELQQIVQRPSAFGFAAIATSDVLTDGPMDYEPYLEKLAPTLEALRSSYRYILIDSPPVIPFLDSSILAGHVDQVVLIVESNATRSEVLNHAIDKMKSAGANISGILLNKREFYIPKWVYRLL
jgi:Mrp family chromosome partitioning ATPase